jgi:hypothetical protein
MDRELTRAELDELLPLHALDALDGEELEQVERYVARDEAARVEVASLREAASWLPPADVRAPESLWGDIEQALEARDPGDASAPKLLALETAHRRPRGPLGRRLVAVLAAAAIVLALVLGIQVVRQQQRIDDLAAEMHSDPLERQARAARASADAHVITLSAVDDGDGAEVVMLPDGTGYLMEHELPALGEGSTYQLWAKVGEGDIARMVSLGVLGRAPGITPFQLAANPTMFEVTEEPANGSDAPSDRVVVRGEVS